MPIIARCPRGRRAHPFMAAASSSPSPMEVAGDLFSLLRDLRTDCSNHTAAERAKLRALSLELPDLLVPLQKYLKKPAAALLALSKIARAIADVAPSQETLLLEGFARAGVLKAVVRICSKAAAANDTTALCTGVSIVSNTAFLRCSQLVVESGAAALLVQLLCDEAADEATNAFAAAALRHMAADAHGASAFGPQQKREVLAALRSLVATDDLVARGYVLGAASALKANASMKVLDPERAAREKAVRAREGKAAALEAELAEAEARAATLRYALEQLEMRRSGLRVDAERAGILEAKASCE